MPVLLRLGNLSGGVTRPQLTELLALCGATIEGDDAPKVCVCGSAARPSCCGLAAVALVFLLVQLLFPTLIAVVFLPIRLLWMCLCVALTVCSCCCSHCVSDTALAWLPW